MKWCLILVLNKNVPSSTLVRLYIDELETNLDEIDEDSSCLFHIVVAILLYADDVVLLSK